MTETPPPLAKEAQIVNKHFLEDFSCSICLELLDKPRQCKNGHLFCLDCITIALKVKGECPQCRCPMTTETLIRSLIAEKTLPLVAFWCQYHKNTATDSCQFQGTADETIAHQLQCPFQPAECPNSPDCIIIRKDADGHGEVCPHRPQPCRFCKEVLPLSTHEKHEGDCKSRPETCPSCSVDFPRLELASHLANDCPAVTLPCPFQDAGCQAQFLRTKLPLHLSSQAAQHSLLSHQHWQQKFAQLEESFESRLKALVLRSSTEQSIVVDWPLKKFSASLRYAQFSASPRYIQSEIFTFAEFDWFLGCYPNGDNPENAGFLSAYLFMNTTGPHRRISIKFSLCVMQNEEPAFEKKFNANFPVQGGSGWGDRRFMPTEQALGLSAGADLHLRIYLTALRNQITLSSKVTK